MNECHIKCIAPKISPNKGGINGFNKNCLIDFVKEVKLYGESNNDPAFWTKNHERTLLSLFFNGIARNPKNKDVSILQEFSVRDRKNKFRSVGRCDGFINYNQNAIYVEAKRLSGKIYENHWDIDLRKQWDDNVRLQLKKYHTADSQQPDTFYKKQYLITIVFQILKEPLLVYKKKWELFFDEKCKSQTALNNWFSILVYDEYEKSSKDILEVYGIIEEFATNS